MSDEEKNLDAIRLKMIERSIIALEESIRAIESLDIYAATDMYNTILKGFESLEKGNENEENKTIKRSIEKLGVEHKKVIKNFESGSVDSLIPIIKVEILERYETLRDYITEKIFLDKNHIDIEDRYYKKFKKAGLLNDIDEKVIEEILEYWDRHYGEKIDTSLHIAFYNQTGIIEPRLISQKILNTEILPVCNDSSVYNFYSDKNIYDLLIEADSAPEVVLKRVNDNYFDSQNKTINREEAFRILFKMREDLIVKASQTDDGKAIEKIEYKNHGFYFKKKKIDLRDIEENWGSNFIVQRYVKQHPIMAAPHKYSVNTLRMVTLRWDGEIQYLTTFARFGSGKQIKDNIGKGGFAVAVSPEGEFNKFAMDQDGRIHEKHPTTGFEFKNLRKIPNFDQYIDFVKRLHNKILHNNYVSWDVIMGMDGRPIFLEMNFRGAVWIYQLITERPIFGDLTEDILKKAKLKKERKQRELKNKKVYKIKLES